jgi:copper chaperone CopZ
MNLKNVITAFVFFVFAQSAKAQTNTITSTEKNTNDTTITIKVKGVTCSNDLKTLSNNVKELKGVKECKPGKAGAVSVFNITYNPLEVSTKEIYKAIENTGGCSNPKDRPYKVKSK